MTREITNSFLCKRDLNFDVRVFDEKVTSTQDITNETIIFILNPIRLNQQDLLLLLKHQAIYIFFENKDQEYSLDNHPLKLLLNDPHVNEYLGRIKGLNKNVMELYVEKNRWWNLFDGSNIYKQLFSIKNLGFCFVEYPVVTENVLNLDDIFIRERAETESPKEIITRYLKYMEEDADSRIESMNRRNAFKDVFLFYKGSTEKYQFDLEKEKVLFLLDVLQLNSAAANPKRCASLIGALTAACAYFVHAGQPQSYIDIVQNILNISKEANGNITLKYKYIPENVLEELKVQNQFLYYHLSCRIPNQYLVALFDKFLITWNEPHNKQAEEQMEILIQYLTEQIKTLSLLKPSMLWEFKRDQEIGAICGSIGQILLYKEGYIQEKISAFTQAEEYIKKSIEYAHPAEKERDFNYLIQCRLGRAVHIYDGYQDISDLEKEISNLAKRLAMRFQNGKKYNTFDIMVAAEVISAANAFLSSEQAVKISQLIGLDWNEGIDFLKNHSYLYASHLAVGYVLLFPEELTKSIEKLQEAIERGKKFFGLEMEKYVPTGIMNLIAVKFMTAFFYFLCRQDSNEKLKAETINKYKKYIQQTPLPIKLQKEYIQYMNVYMDNQQNSAVQALKLIFKIPY